MVLIHPVFERKGKGFPLWLRSELNVKFWIDIAPARQKVLHTRALRGGVLACSTYRQVNCKNQQCQEY